MPEKPVSKRDLSDVLTHSMEDYIKTIYNLLQQHERATTIRIAEQLGFSAASVTNMLQKLARLKLVTYTRYQGVQLTETGERIALEILRHHRLLELYLSEHMGYSWDAVHAEAEKLEHVISEEFEARIDELLGYPDTDPHGHPIPTKEGTINVPQYHPLTEIEAGGSAIVRRVNDDDPAVLRRLGDVGLYLGAEVNIVAGESDGGGDALHIRVGSIEHRLDAAHAAHVFVERVDGN